MPSNWSPLGDTGATKSIRVHASERIECSVWYHMVHLGTALNQTEPGVRQRAHRLAFLKCVQRASVVMIVRPLVQCLLCPGTEASVTIYNGYHKSKAT